LRHRAQLALPNPTLVSAAPHYGLRYGSARRSFTAVTRSDIFRRAEYDRNPETEENCPLNPLVWQNCVRTLGLELTESV
jgi:hypothetical protein